MRVLLLGDSGIIGQHMRADVPREIEVSCASRARGVDLSRLDSLADLLRERKPDVVVNLAGESNTDKVEANPVAYEPVNVGLPYTLARLTDLLKFRLVQVSSQAVFGGSEPPYGLNAPLDPINKYGWQKAMAETIVQNYSNVNIVRPTFVLGVRPEPHVGRTNPIEQMLGGEQRRQVADRWFSVAFAPDVARLLWSVARLRPDRRVIHAGIPKRVSRYQIARDLGLEVEPVSHDSFPGLAPRPVDTSYAVGDFTMTYEEGLADCKRRWEVIVYDQN